MSADTRSNSKLITLAKGSTIASGYAALLVLCYLLLFASACPERELIIAIAIEVSIFAMIMGWRLFRTKSEDGQAKTVVLSELASNSRRLSTVRRAYQRLVLAGSMIVCLAMSFDLAALACAAFGNSLLSQSLYTHVPISVALGLHPAASLEMLAGAYVKAGKYAQAEPLYALISQIRIQIYGPDHEMMVALDADFGDLYLHQKRFAEAQEFYLKSIQLSKEIKSPAGYGRPLTGLANCYREMGANKKAEYLYKEALSMREKIYGPNSVKVAETLREYAIFMSKTGSQSKSLELTRRVSEIEACTAKKHSLVDNCFPILICLLSLGASHILFGRQGLLTSIVTKQIRAKADSGQATDSEIKNLILLYQYQKRPDQAQLFAISKNNQIVR